jgi:hypothetical protein
MMALAAENAPSVFTRAQAMASTRRDEWISAELRELLQLLDESTVRFVSARNMRGRRPLRVGWKHYIKPDGRLRCRFYVCGYSQQHGRDYWEVYAPTARASTVRLVLAVAARYGLRISLLDVRTAFMTSPIDVEGLFARMPPGYELYDEEGFPIFLELLGGINGLRQGAHLFYVRVEVVMLAFGFVQCSVDVCLYIFREGTELLVVAVHVDDFVCAWSCGALFERFLRHFEATFKCSRQDDPPLLLGGELQYLEDGGFRYTNRRLIGTLAATMGFETAASVPSVARDGLILPRSDVVEELSDAQRAAFAEVVPQLPAVVGLASYIVGSTMPEGLRLVREAQGTVSTPSWALFEALKRFARYAINHADEGIVFAGRSTQRPVMAYADAAYLTDIMAADTEGSSWRGHAVYVYGGLVEALSTRVRVIAPHVMAIELLASTGTLSGVERAVTALREMGLEPEEGPLALLVTDSQPLIGAAERTGTDLSTRHLRMHMLLLQQELRSGLILLGWTRSADMPADVLTKHVQRVITERLVPMLRGAVPIPDAVVGGAAVWGPQPPAAP